MSDVKDITDEDIADIEVHWADGRFDAAYWMPDIIAALKERRKLLAVAEAAKGVGCRGADEMNPEWVRLGEALAALEKP